MKMNANISLFSSKTEGTGIERTTQISHKKWPSTSKERVSERRSSDLHLNIYMLQSVRLLIFSIHIRVSHNTPFFELSYALLTSHAIGLEEATKKISAL